MQWWELNFKTNDSNQPVYQECEVKLIEIKSQPNDNNGKYNGYYQKVTLEGADPVIPVEHTFYYHKASDDGQRLDADSPNKPLQVQCKVEPGNQHQNINGKKYTFRLPRVRGAGNSGGGFKKGGGGGHVWTKEEIIGLRMHEYIKILVEKHGSCDAVVQMENEIQAAKVIAIQTHLEAALTPAQKLAEGSQPPI